MNIDTMKTGEELSLIAMKKELKRLSYIAEKNKKNADDACNVCSEMIAIHKEFMVIIKGEDYSESASKKLLSLQKRRNKCEKIMENDLLKLLDKKINAEIHRDQLDEEIQKLELIRHLRKTR
jgi:hypothetical protein